MSTDKSAAAESERPHFSSVLSATNGERTPTRFAWLRVYAHALLAIKTAASLQPMSICHAQPTTQPQACTPTSSRSIICNAVIFQYIIPPHESDFDHRAISIWGIEKCQTNGYLTRESLHVAQKYRNWIYPSDLSRKDAICTNHISTKVVP